MNEMIMALGTNPEEMVSLIGGELKSILETKRRAVISKLEAVRKAFHERIEPHLTEYRSQQLMQTENLR